MRKLIDLATLLFIISCVPGQESAVEVAGQSSIVNKVKVTSSIAKDIGEWSLESDPLHFTITLQNNSSRAITNLGVSLNKLGKVDGLDYSSSKSLAKYPGEEGTCGSTVQSGGSCTIKLTFDPTQSGRFHYEVAFKYKNLISDESQKLEFVALAGIPASLVYTNEESQYDLGLVEQVDDEGENKRFPIMTRLEIENRGELSATNIAFFMESTNAEPNAFSVAEHNCPEKLAQYEKCTIDVAYNPLNQGINDPEAKYASSIAITYGSDQNDKPATLTGNFKALSTKIVGRFERSGLENICFRPDEDTPCGPTTVGNEVFSNFKVINKGYQKAIIKKITVAMNDMLVHCEVGMGEDLLCYEVGKFLKYNADEGMEHWYLNGGDRTSEYTEPDGYTCQTIEEDVDRICLMDNPPKTQLTLYQFPYLIQDTDLCMTNETRVSGKDIFNQGSERCEIGIKFHPPIHYNREGFVPNGIEVDSFPPEGAPIEEYPPVEIGVIYDSLWKDIEGTYIETSPMLFLANPRSLSQGRLRVTRFSFGSLSTSYKTTDQSLSSGDVLVNYDQAEYEYDLGRYPMVLDNTIKTDGRIKIKNFGNTRAYLTSVGTRHGLGIVEIPSKDSNGATKVDVVCSPSGEPFFRNVRHDCSHNEETGESFVDPGDQCDIRFDFTPVSETNKIYQNYCMFGIATDDGRYNQACYDSPSSCNVLTDDDFRRFEITYSDGVTLDDDGNPIESQHTIAFKIDASLAASGKLEIGTMSSSGFPNYFSKNLDIEIADPESYNYGFMALRNVGSNSIPYIYLPDNYHLDPQDYNFSGDVHGMAFVEADLHPLVADGTYKDCYYLIQNKPQDRLKLSPADYLKLFPTPLPHEPGTSFNNSDFITTLDSYQGSPETPVTFLDKGETCVLAFRYKRPYGQRDRMYRQGVTYESFSNNFDALNGRSFLQSFPFNHEDCNGTLEILRPARRWFSSANAEELRFFYFDNDTDTTGGLVPDHPDLGNHNYVYQTTEEVFRVDSEEKNYSSAYAEVRATSLLSLARQPAKSFPGIDMSPYFQLDPQEIAPVYYRKLSSGSAHTNMGSFVTLPSAIQIFENMMVDVEALSGQDFDNYDYAINLGIFPNVDSTNYSVTVGLDRESVVNNEFTSVTYTPLYSASGGEPHKITASLNPESTTQTFTINPSGTTTGFHIGVLEFSYLSNIKVETSRIGNYCTNYLGDESKNGDSDNYFKMVDFENPAKFDYLPVTKKVLVFTKIYEPDLSPQFNIYAQSYNICQDPATKVISENDPYSVLDDGNCPLAPPFGAEHDFGETFKFGQTPDNSAKRSAFLMEDIFGDELYSKARFRVENTGSIAMENLRLDIMSTKGSIHAANNMEVLEEEPGEVNQFDFLVMNTGAPNHSSGALPACKDTLLPGESCAFYIKFHATNYENSFNRWLGITYSFGDEGAVMSENFQVQFGVLDPAIIRVEGFGTPLATLNDLTDDQEVEETNVSQFIDADYGNLWAQQSAVAAIRLPLGVVTLDAAPTVYQFHLKLTAVSGDLQAYVRQDFWNVDTEDVDWAGTDFNKDSNVDGKSRINIDYNFTGSPIYPDVVPCAVVQAGDAGLNDSDSCLVVINYRIDEKYVNAPTAGNLNGHEGFFMKYCNNYPGLNPLGCSTGELYFVFVGDIVFPEAEVAGGSNLLFSNIEANDNGEVSFSWSEVDFNPNWSDGVVDYVIDYGSGTKTLSNLEVNNLGDIANREATIEGLINGNYYNFEVRPILRSKITGDNHSVVFKEGQQKVKVLVPDEGLTYFHDQGLLIKPVNIPSDYYTVESVCQDPVSIGGINQPMRVFNQTHYDFLNGIAHPSINPFSIYWTQDTDFVDEVLLEEVECLFPAPSLATSDDFFDAEIYKLIGDTEGSGYKNDNHESCYKNYLWVPADFIGSSLEAKTICIYDDLDL